VKHSIIISSKLNLVFDLSELIKKILVVKISNYTDGITQKKTKSIITKVNSGIITLKAVVGNVHCAPFSLRAY
jgi:hypothetical protein